jgi:hypothetical protein
MGIAAAYMVWYSHTSHQHPSALQTPRIAKEHYLKSATHKLHRVVASYSEHGELHARARVVVGANITLNRLVIPLTHGSSIPL